MRRLGVLSSGRRAATGGVLHNTAEEVVLAQPLRSAVEPPQLRNSPVVPDPGAHALAVLRRLVSFPPRGRRGHTPTRIFSYTFQRADAQPATPMPWAFVRRSRAEKRRRR